MPPAPPAVAEEFEVPTPRQSEHLDRLSLSSTRSVLKPKTFRAGVGLENVARRTLGIFLLLVTVFLWTASNFLASVCYDSLQSHKPRLLTCAVHIRG
jgi:solute carrier family 35 protein F5